MRWTAPPERREILLVLFSISAYLIAYNIETSLNYVGIDPVAAQGALFRQIGLGKTKLLARDGLKPAGWRDKLETAIFGSWDWKEGHIAGDGTERSQLLPGRGKHGAQWMDKKAARSLDHSRFGDDTINGAYVSWMEDVPVVNVVKHVPGYTILDNVIIHNGTIYLVSDDKNSIPPIRSIIENSGRGAGEWKVINRKEAASRVGKYGGIVKGVSLMTVSEPTNTTLVDLWRMYSTLDQHIDAQGHTNLPAPSRLIFPHIPFFSDSDPETLDEEDVARPRERSDIALHPYLLKAAFPQMVVQYEQDWQDYHKMEVPFVFERIVISDRDAAAKSVNEGQPTNSPPYNLDASQYWWEPIRRTLVTYFDRLDEETKAADDSGTSFWSFSTKAKKVITYIDNHDVATRSGQSALIPGDYEYFSRSLKKLGRDKGYEVHIVSPQRSWDATTDLIVRSTIVIGVHGDHLFDAMWMRRSPRSTFIELFPQGVFTRDREVVMRSLGINYVAWWTDDSFSGESLPKVTENDNSPVHINTNKIMNMIHRILVGNQNP